MYDKATTLHQNMSVDNKIKKQLADLVESKLQDDKKISELVDKAEILKKRLRIDTEHATQ